MKVAFRIDDVSPYMDWHNFRRVAELFISRGVMPLMGVIPDNQDPALLKLPYNGSGWAELRALKNRGWLVAQHGYQHVYTTQNAGLLSINSYSEFAGVPMAHQLTMLRRGQEILAGEDLASQIFMAPAHSYDDATLEALLAADFRTVTDGYGLFAYRRNGLTFIPCQSSKPHKLPLGIMTVCLHPNTMTPAEIDGLGQWIDTNKPLVCSYSDLLSSPVPVLLGRLTEKAVLVLRRWRKGS